MAIQNPTSVASPLVVAPLGISAVYQFTRPNDANAYTANDVVGSAAAGAVLPFTFKGVPVTGAEIVIDAVRFEVQETALLASEASYGLALYNFFPPSNLADNAAYDITANDRPYYQGILTLGTPVDLGSTCYVEISNQQKHVSLLSPTLYCYLTTAGAYTPTAFQVYRLWVYGRLV